MKTFLTIWFGQFVSMIGTSMTRFALIYWAYQQTGSATTLGLMGFFAFGSIVITGAIAGPWIDRYNRRTVMLLTDSVAAAVTVVMLGLVATNHLQVWHLYLAHVITGAMHALQSPAYSAAIAILIPRERLTRANGLDSLAYWASDVAAPVMAGLMLRLVGLSGVMLVDTLTFGVAAVTLLVVRIPSVPPHPSEDQRQPWRQRFTVGLRYVMHERGLRGMLVIYSVVNLFAAFTYYAVLPALILSRSGHDELALAVVQTGLGIGGVIGSLMLSAWGGPRRKIHGFLAGTALTFITGDFLFAVGRGVPVWLIGAVVTSVFIPFLHGSYMAIWQERVPQHLQGRAFLAQNTLRLFTRPIGYIMGGVLADHLFEPAMTTDGALAPWLGWLVGTGSGAGIAVMFLITAVGGCLTGLAGYLVADIRHVEDLPLSDDHPMSAPLPALEATAEGV